MKVDTHQLSSDSASSADSRLWRPSRDGPRLLRLLLGVLASLLTGCATQMPAEIRTSGPVALTLSEARAAPEHHAGTRVRWGGRILAVRNGPESTDVELLAWPLDATGRPELDPPAETAADGRFIARFNSFLDPARYTQPRLLTVLGTLVGVETRPVGEYPYRYPVVAVIGSHLWPGPAPSARWSRYPDPWPWDPWYRWGVGPWGRPGLPYGPWYWY